MPFGETICAKFGQPFINYINIQSEPFTFHHHLIKISFGKVDVNKNTSIVSECPPLRCFTNRQRSYNATSYFKQCCRQPVLLRKVHKSNPYLNMRMFLHIRIEIKLPFGKSQQPWSKIISINRPCFHLVFRSCKIELKKFVT